MTKSCDETAAFFVPHLQVLKKRSDFLRASKARYRVTPHLSLQGHPTPSEQGCELAIRVGFTCSKKVGNAVARNRAKRRLRELARLVLRKSGKPGWTYVLIGRRETTGSCVFSELEKDLKLALIKVHQ